jgi:hypothetical protein
MTAIEELIDAFAALAENLNTQLDAMLDEDVV